MNNKTIDDFEKPQNLRERRAYYRFFYHTNPVVGNFVDEHSYKNFTLGDIIHPGGSPGLRLYVYDFFQKMCDRLGMGEFISQIAHEYLLMGNCTVFAVDGEMKQREKANNFDSNPSYRGWKKVLILPPDQVRIRKIPMSQELYMDYVPDPDTMKSVKEDKKMNKLLKNGIIHLDTNPDSGFFTHFFSRKATQYDTIGISIIEKHIDDLSNGKNASMYISENETKLLDTKIKKFVEEFLFKIVAVKKGFMGPGRDALYPEVIFKEGA